jgi:uncharacterized protein YndB with AHSA1/START domain
MIKWVLIVGGVLVAILILVLIIGLLLPKAHVASRSARFKQSPQVIFEIISDWRSFPSWREGVKGVTERAGESGRVSWIETSSMGQMPFEVLESVPARRLVTKIADPKLPFGGTWMYDIEPTGDGGSTLTITEYGEVYNPLFRFMSRFIFGYTATMESYHRSLSRKLGPS